MEKADAINILKTLYRNIQNDEITLPCLNFYEQIKKEHLQAIDIAITVLNENVF